MYKVDLENYEIVAHAQDFLWGHANDVTFDTRRGLIVVSHCNEYISLVDPDTLCELEVKKLATGGKVKSRKLEKFPKISKKLLQKSKIDIIIQL